MAKYIYIVYAEKGDPLLVLPLVVQKRTTKMLWVGQKKGIYFLGIGSYSDYLNAVYKDISDETLNALFQTIKKDFPKLNINFTLIAENTYITDYFNRKGISPSGKTISVAVRKKESLEQYNQSLSKHVKQNIRTAINRAYKDGIKYELSVLPKTEDLRLIKELQQLHIKRMKDKEMKSGKSDLPHKIYRRIFTFIRAYKEKHNNIVVKSMQTMEQSKIIIVKLNSNIAGYLYCLSDDKAIRVLQNVVDNKYSFYSPMFRGIYDYITQLYETNETQCLVLQEVPRNTSTSSEERK